MGCTKETYGFQDPKGGCMWGKRMWKNFCVGKAHLWKQWSEKFSICFLSMIVSYLKSLALLFNHWGCLCCKHRNRPWDQGKDKVRNRLKHIRTFLASIFDERFAARFYDTAGLDSQQREVPKHLLAAADGFVIVYSVEDKQSFILAEAIRKEIKNCGEKRDQVASPPFDYQSMT